MVRWLYTLLLLSLTSARPRTHHQPGYWKLSVNKPQEPTYFSGYRIPAGTPFLGLMKSVKLEDLFLTVGQHYDVLPRGEYVLEALTEGGCQVMIHTESGDRYKKFPPPRHLPGQKLDLQLLGYWYDWTWTLDIGKEVNTASERLDKWTLDKEKESLDTGLGKAVQGSSSDIDDPVNKRKEQDVIFSHRLMMDKEGRYHVSWSPGEEGITFKLEVETLGFVGLGFSPNGKMLDADIVIAWVDDDDGEVHLTDRHGLGNFLPPLDTSQDLQLQVGYQNDTHTVVEFYRVWDTCDEDDAKLGQDTVRMIWSYHQEDHLQYHTHAQRGVKSVYLKEPPLLQAAPLERHKVWDITAGNMTIPGNEHTVYWSRIFKIPELALKSKHHIIAVEPLIQPGSESYVHHIVMKTCVAPSTMGTSADLFEEYVGHPGAQSYTPDQPPVWYLCHSIFVGWAVGNTGMRWPHHVGAPMGEEFGGSTYFKLEMHYNNAALHSGIVDNSGLRVIYTDELREMDSGLLTMGLEINILHMIPPLQNSFFSTGHCTSDCLSQTVPKEGIRVYSWLPHTHLAGRKVRVRQVRNGTELPVVLEDNNYDFSFQATKFPSSEMLVLPGDTLITECVYNTSDRSSPIYAGLGTRDEMCLVFLAYYPITSLVKCHSGATFSTFLKSLGIEKLFGDSFEQFLSFTWQQLGTKNDRNRTEVIRSLASEVELEDEILEILLDEKFYQDWNLQTKVLFKIMKKVKIEAPEDLKEKTVGDLFEMINWVEEGPEMSEVLAREEQRCHCTAPDLSPLIEFQPHKIPKFIEFEKKDNNCDENV